MRAKIAGFKGRKYFILLALPLLMSGCEMLPKEVLGTEIGGTMGAIIGSKVSRNHRYEFTHLGAVTGAIIGGTIGRMLDEEDRRHLAESTQTAMITGENQRWNNPETGVSGETRIVKTERKREKMQVMADEDVNTIPPLELINDTYESDSEVEVYSGPARSYKVIERIPSKNSVFVVGKVQNGNWYMISRDNVAQGFVAADRMVRSTEALPESKSSAKGTTREVRVARTCRTMEQRVKLKNGKKKKEKVKACNSPNGWQVI